MTLVLRGRQRRSPCEVGIPGGKAQSSDSANAALKCVPEFMPHPMTCDTFQTNMELVAGLIRKCSPLVHKLDVTEHERWINCFLPKKIGHQNPLKIGTRALTMLTRNADIPVPD